MKRSFFQAAVTSILLYGCTTWTLTKRLEKKLDGNYTKMLHAILKKSWWQHPTRHQLYGHLPPIMKTIQVRWTRHAGHSWRSRDELIRDVLLWTPTHGRAKAGRPAWTYIQQLCEDTGCCAEDLPRAMSDREEWRERVRDIRATSAIWWWWYISYLCTVFIVSCNEVLGRREKNYIPDWTNSWIMTSSRQGKQEQSGQPILKESFSSHQRSQPLIGCCQNLKVISISRAISAVICLVWKISSLATEMGVGVRSMSTESFVKGILCCKTWNTPCTQRKHHWWSIQCIHKDV